jgi:hypothetical protein
MRNLVGLEMVCFARSKHFEVRYEGGAYVNENGAQVEGLLDMNCYVCTVAYYTTSGDGIDFCPGCGHFDRKRFDSSEALRDHLLGVDLSWLARNNLNALLVETWEGEWRLTFHRAPAQLDAAGQFKSVRAL